MSYPGKFARDLAMFGASIQTRADEIFERVVELSYESIANGSNITGAPGQPIDTGDLRSSFQVKRPRPRYASIVTKKAYAPVIEAGERKGKPIVLRSQVGGFHSVKLTIAGMERIVRVAAEETS